MRNCERKLTNLEGILRLKRHICRPDRTLVDFGSGAVDAASEEAEEASYRATWANILLWATLHVGMVVRAWYLIHQAGDSHI